MTIPGTPLCLTCDRPDSGDSGTTGEPREREAFWLFWLSLDKRLRPCKSVVQVARRVPCSWSRCRGNQLKGQEPWGTSRYSGMARIDPDLSNAIPRRTNTSQGCSYFFFLKGAQLAEMSGELDMLDMLFVFPSGKVSAVFYLGVDTATARRCPLPNRLQVHHTCGGCFQLHTSLCQGPGRIEDNGHDLYSE